MIDNRLINSFLFFRRNEQYESGDVINGVRVDECLPGCTHGRTQLQGDYSIPQAQPIGLSTTNFIFMFLCTKSAQWFASEHYVMDECSNVDRE